MTKQPSLRIRVLLRLGPSGGGSGMEAIYWWPIHTKTLPRALYVYTRILVFRNNSLEPYEIFRRGAFAREVSGTHQRVIGAIYRH